MMHLGEANIPLGEQSLKVFLRALLRVEADSIVIRNSVVLSSRPAVCQSPSAFSTHSAASIRMEDLAFARDVTHEPIPHPEALVEFFPRTD